MHQSRRLETNPPLLNRAAAYRFTAGLAFGQERSGRRLAPQGGLRTGWRLVFSGFVPMTSDAVQGAASDEVEDCGETLPSSGFARRRGGAPPVFFAQKAKARPPGRRSCERAVHWTARGENPVPAAVKPGMHESRRLETNPPHPQSGGRVPVYGSTCPRARAKRPPPGTSGRPQNRVASKAYLPGRKRPMTSDAVL